MSGATPSQTIGPFFAEGLQWLIDATARAPFVDAVRVSGRVLDADASGVADALLEVWQPTHTQHAGPLSGFQRVATDAEGRFAFWMPRPSAETHSADVTIFARGLLRGLLTRVYLVNVDSDILNIVPVGRQDSLLATALSPDEYQWDVRLSGDRETVFFEL